MNEFINTACHLKICLPCTGNCIPFGLNKGFSMEEHRHSFYHINLILKGSVVCLPERTISVSKAMSSSCLPFSPQPVCSFDYLQIGMDMNPYEDPSGILPHVQGQKCPEGREVLFSTIIKYQ